MEGRSNDRIRIKDIAEQAGVSVGTVDRVLHGRPNVSETSRQRVEEVLKQINYQPNMYASALASNKKYKFVCLLPEHGEKDYWVEVEEGISKATQNMKDFHVTTSLLHYNPFDENSFREQFKKVLELNPSGVMLTPTTLKETKPFTDILEEQDVPYVFIDSRIKELKPLSFYGQDSQKSGIFAAKMLTLLTGSHDEVFLFKIIDEGRVGSTQQEHREEGFRNYMAKNHPDCKIHELILNGANKDSYEEELNLFFSKHKDIQGITFNSKAYVIGEYISKHKLTGVQIMGYDLLQRNADCMRKNSISFLITQHPWIQGFNGIKSLGEHLILKKDVRKETFMPIELLTKENMDYYMKTQQ